MADRPITEISLNDVRKLIDDKNIGEGAANAVGHLLGIVLALSPVVAGPAALPLWALIEPKNELIESFKSVARKFSRSKPSDYLDRAERMAAANCLLVYVAFFEAVRQQWSTMVRELGVTEEQAKNALTEASYRVVSPSADEILLADWAIPIQHPAEGSSLGMAARQASFLQMATRVADVFPAVGRRKWTEAENERRDLAHAIASHAEKLYQAERLGMAVEFQQFFVWSMLWDQAAKDRKVQQLATDQQTWFELIGRAMHTLDLGMQGLAQAIARLPGPTLTGAGQPDVQAVAEALHRTYADSLQQQVIDEQFPSDDTGARLGFPRKIEGFVPQAYRRVLYDKKDVSLADEDAWRRREVHGGIGAFILRYLESPYSVLTPLLILGHPGSGKSLLTEVLAGHLAYPSYTTIRVKLRDADPDVGFLTQLEEQIRADTGGQSSSWAHFAEGLSMCPPVVILDGYDELLQATGKVYASYLDEVPTVPAPAGGAAPAGAGDRDQPTHAHRQGGRPHRDHGRQARGVRRRAP